VSIFAGDELYDDDVTSGPVDDNYAELDDDDLSGEFSDVAQGRWDYD